MSKRAAPRPPPNVVISSDPPLTNAPYGQSGKEVNPSSPSSYWVAREPRMKDVREYPPSQNPQGQNICATLYTEREQWTDLSVPKSTRCARPGEERTPLSVSLSHIPLWRRLLFSKLKIECRRLKQFTSPFRTHVPSSLFLPELSQVDPFDLNKFHGNDISPLSRSPPALRNSACTVC